MYMLMIYIFIIRMRDIVKIVSLLPSATELIAAVIEDSSEAILVGRASRV